ncbi:MAG TPA: hypothetical protein VE871_18575 [Longimicrobium sp.]|nr:hypothetical protein [Longimicrobium sp.]
MDIDENPAGVLIGGTLYWAFLLGIGLLMPVLQAGAWMEHGGLLPRGRVHVASGTALLWVLIPGFCLGLLMIGGLGRFLWPLERALMYGCGFGLFLPAFFASGLIVLVSLTGLGSDRAEAYIYLANVGGWTCYAVYLFIAQLLSPSDGDVAPTLTPRSPSTTGVDETSGPAAGSVRGSER